MSLASAAAQRTALLRAFRGALSREEEAWPDHRYQQIREQYLEPLALENERFDRDLAAVIGSATAAARRLEESR